MKPTGITFSVVVLTCNQRSFTLRLMQSLRPYLASHPDSELILVDNGSADGTREAIMPMADEPDSRISYIHNAVNKGVAAGRNLGLAHARGRILTLLDNDTVITAEAIDSLRRHLEENPKCGIAAPAMISPDGQVQSSAKPFPGLGIKVSHLMRPGRELECERREMLSPHPFYVIGACQMFRREVLEAVGELDENIFYGPEDADFCMRVREAGYTIDYLPEISIVHDWRRATRRSPFSRLARLHFRSLLYFYRKHRRLS